MPGLRIIPARAGFTASGSPRVRGAADHPRSRGVYPRPGRPQGDRAGSSPLARGLRETMCEALTRARIIPARAGFTRMDGARPGPARDHPRSRGVYVRPRGPPVPGGGSSPLARGLRTRLEVLPCGSRIIPARAGFTHRRRRGPRGVEDHPRSRGVYDGLDVALDRSQGSSPLARGLLMAGVMVVVMVGIIPARAGFTSRERPGIVRLADHPRSRGVYSGSLSVPPASGGSSPLARGLPPSEAGWAAYELDHPRSRGVYPTTQESDDMFEGSSPLARGLPCPSPCDECECGIIPARAGFTLGAQRPLVVAQDHPRSRGVYPPSTPLVRRRRGSSPLARGLPSRIAPAQVPMRIIPARAGFTNPAAAAGPCRQDHPRSRGVYRSWRRRAPCTSGSSPLARGLPSALRYGPARPGIIPARAGFTRR